MPRSAREASVSHTATDRTGRRRLGATAFGVRDFRYLWAAQIFRGLVVWMQSLVLPWLMLRSGGTPFDVGLAAAVQFLPSAFLSPLVGAAIVRRDKRRILLATQSGTALVTGLLLLAATTGAERAAVYIAALAFGLIGAVDNPVRHALLGQLVPGRLVTSAVGLNATIFSITRVVGPSVAAILIVSAGIPFTLGVMVIASSSGAILLARLRPDTTLEGDSESPALVVAFREGLRYVSSDPTRWVILASLSVSVIVVGGVQAILPAFVVITSPGDPASVQATTLGAMLTVIGIGALVGGILFGLVASAPSLRLSVRASVALSLVVVAVSSAGSITLILTALGLYGFLGTVAVTLLNSRLQRATDDVFRARVMSLYVAVYALSTAIGSFVGGLLAEILQPRTALTVIGFAGASIGILLLRRVRHQDAGPGRNATD